MTIVTEQEPIDMDSEPDSAVPATEGTGNTAAPKVRIRYQIRFAKTGLLRWISHRDLARLWERLLRRARLVLSMTEGFHPKPRIGFPSALALGVESIDEVVEIDLAEELSPEVLLQKLESDQQPGLDIKSVTQLPDGFGKAQLVSSDYTISVVDAVDTGAIEDAIRRLLTQQEVTIERKKKQVAFKVSEQILQLELAGSVLNLRLAASQAATLRPGDILDLLGFADWVEKGTLIRRVAVKLKQQPEENGDIRRAVSTAWLEKKQINHQDHHGENT